MRKNLFCVVVCLCFLTGCTQSPPKAEMIANDLVSRCTVDDYQTIVAVSVPREQETLHYSLQVETHNHQTTVTVLSPESLAGISATIDDELTLSYDGMILDAGSLLSRVSAINAVPLCFQTVSSGYLLDYGSETFGDEKMLRLCFQQQSSEGTLCVTLWLSQEQLPKYAEIEDDKGQTVLSLQFSEFSFDHKEETTS